MPDAVIPHLNEVTLYGKVDSFSDGIATIDCIGGRNPKTNQFTHRYADVNIGEGMGDATGKKLFIKGRMLTEKIDDKDKLTVSVDYDKIYTLG